MSVRASFESYLGIKNCLHLTKYILLLLVKDLTINYIKT